MRYRVTSDEKEFEVTVERIDEEDADKLPKVDSAEIVLEAIKTEYNHCVSRSEKLDNKIYILLTICAFVFAFSTTSLTQIRNFSKPVTLTQECMLITYMVILIGNIGLFGYLLFKLVKLLEGEKIKRLDAEDLLIGDFFSLPPKVAARAIAQIYLDAMTVNNSKLEVRFQAFNSCSKLLFSVIVLSIAESFLGNFLQ